MSYDSDNHIPYILGLSEAMDAQPGSTAVTDLESYGPEVDTKPVESAHIRKAPHNCEAG